MEHESFEDEEVAAILNQNFVSIKVDREERPDVDHIYMTVCQAMSGQGGWPLTIVMTPEKKPFFAGTYFPKNRKYGRYGLTDILPVLAEKWREGRNEIEQYGDHIVERIHNQLKSHAEGEISEHILDKAYAHYEQIYDPEFGGFGSAPKFPSSHNLSFLLRYSHQTGKAKALEMVEKTLDAMCRGGMYDHIGFGFARYSTDRQWLVPHFEKMLYDNALLAYAYLEAYQVTGKRKYAQIAEQIFTYVLRDMTDSQGGFYSAEDADSEGHEGKFYVWEPDEILEVLGATEGRLFCDLYDITDQGNFEGHSIANLIEHTYEEFAERMGIPPDRLQDRMEAARRKLFAHREGRVHPGKDDKILTAWNGLMIAALAKGCKALGNERYGEAAKNAAEFVLRYLRREDGRLLARYRDGETAYLGYADDYAFFTWGLIELYEATFEVKYLQLAADLTREMLRLFWDDEQGGFFFTGSDSEKLFARPKESYDGAMPSGNSLAALNLLKLSRYLYDAEFSQKADELFRAFAGTLEQYPSGHSMLLTALSFAYGPGREIVIAGDPHREDTQQMIRAVHRKFLPQSIMVLVPDGEGGEAVRKAIPPVRDKVSIGGRATAYVCENFACHAPVVEIDKLEESLQSNLFQND